MADEFLWEHYSTDASDRGVETEIVWRGKKIPLRVKRALTLDERQRANDVAFKFDVDKEGAAHIVKQDQGAFTKEVVLIGLKYWPFEYSPGNPVPINRKTINEADGGLLDIIASRILGITEVDKAALDPFVRKSEEDYSQEEAPIPS